MVAKKKEKVERKREGGMWPNKLKYFRRYEEHHSGNLS